MNDQAIRFRLGIFVLASLILLAVLVTLFGGLPDFFKSRNSYTLVFDDGRGLTAGTPVFKSGVKIGEVSSVTLTEDGKVEVNVSLDQKFPLRKNDLPTIEKGLIGGDATITLNQDKANPELGPVQPGERVKGTALTDATSLIQKTGDLVTPVGDAINQMNKTLGQMNKILGRVDKESLDRLERMLIKSEASLDDIQKGIKLANDIMPDLQRGIKLAGDLIPDIQRGVKLASDIVPDLKVAVNEVAALTKAVKEVVPDAKRTLQEVQVLSQRWGKVGERTDLLMQTYEPKVAKMLDTTLKATEGVAGLLTDENQKNAAEILKNARKGSERIDGITQNLNEILRDGKTTMKKAEMAMEKAEKTMESVEKGLKPFADRGPAIAKNLDESLVKLNKVMEDSKALIQAIGRADGTFAKFIMDPSLYNNLNDSAVAIARILPRFDRVMRDVETFADKIARHPESIGVGGAIRPSSGLK